VRIQPTLTFILCATAGAYWGIERHTTSELRERLEAIRDQRYELTRLRQERNRLLRLQPGPGEPQQYGVEVHPSGQDAGIVDEQSDAKTVSLKPGLWASASTWRNQGRATPEAAVETMLWAAAGGDVTSMKDTLVLDRDARLKANEILADLASTPRQFASVEDLAALVVAGKVPLDSAQIVARQQNQDDQVTEYLRLKNAKGQTRQVFLSLVRAPGGWQLVVPGSALEEFGRARTISNAP
jgi:hypothetical protein